MSNGKETYEVKETFYLNQHRIDPAPQGQPVRTVSLTEREARYHVLAGALAPKAHEPANPASKPAQSTVEAPSEG